MRSRPRLLWASIRDSLWFAPAAMTLAITTIGAILLRAELAGSIRVGDGYLLLSGGAEAARSLLAAVAGGLITVTGVAFSVTVVALQLSSSQFTPRVLPSFMSDRSNQFVLGILIGTFTYCLIVLRVVDDPVPGADRDLPRASIALAMVLAVISIATLIFFINHAARSIQISVILFRATAKALAQVDDLFPEHFGDEGELPDDEIASPDRAVVRATRSGYIQGVDDNPIFGLAPPQKTIIRMQDRIGAFVLEGQPLVDVSPAAAVTGELTEAVRKALVIGHERTFDQDYELSLVEISDVAVKALSPGINDPTTAHHAIDRLSELLLALAVRHSPGHIRTDGRNVYMIIKDLPFDVALDSAFTPIMHFGASNPSILARLVQRLDTLAELVPDKRKDAVVQIRATLLRRGAATPTRI